MILSILKCKGQIGAKVNNILFVFLIIELILNLICTILQGVFFGKIIKNDLAYNCSDDITNDVLRLENLNTKKSIIYSWINLGADALFLLLNAVVIIIEFIKKKFLEYQVEVNFRNRDKATSHHYDNSAQNEFNLNIVPIREVEIQNKLRNINEKYNNNFNYNNNINNNDNIINNNENITPPADLGVNKVNAPGFSSESIL